MHKRWGRKENKTGRGQDAREMWRNLDSVIRRQREIEGCRRQTENNGGCNAARQKKDTRNTEKMETNDTRSPSGLMGRLGLLWMSKWFSQRLFCTQRCSLQCQSILQIHTHTHSRTLYFVFFEKKVCVCLLACHLSVCFPLICVLCVPRQRLRFQTDITLRSTHFIL